MRRTTVIVVVAVCVVLAAAVGVVTTVRFGRQPDAGPASASPTSTPTGSVAARIPPLAAPRPDRPVVHLRYDVAADHRSVEGMETVRFTPDERVCDRLVFRAWPNKPEIADAGGSLTVHEASVAGQPVDPRVRAKGAPPDVPGTLVGLPLDHCVRAGHPVTARLTFTARMARHSGERVGDNGNGEMWFATAYPVLAWEHGHGWMTEPAVDVFGEMDASEEFRLSLAVVAPEDDTVLGTGRSLGTSRGPRDGTVTHRFAAASVRGVAVAVGGYDLANRTVDGVRVHLGTSDDGTRTPAANWLDKIGQEIPRLERYFGPFPYRDLWVTVIPETTGIEFPGAIYYGDYPPQPVATGALVGHELAHMWFYSLVGDDQARDPWLDEAFAEYGQALADGTVAGYADVRVSKFARERVGAPMTYWAKNPQAYGEGVYRQGAKMLFQARERAGPKRWDKAVRAYIAKNAHRIVRPRDFLRAVSHLPGAARLLHEYGAVSR